MAETLLAILLVTSSAEESTISFRWPPYPKPSSFDEQPATIVDNIGDDDAPAHPGDNGRPQPTPTSPNLGGHPELEAQYLQDDEDDFDGEWSRPGLSRARIRHPEQSLSPEVRQASLSPGQVHDFLRSNDEEDDRSPEYDELLGFSRKQLARMLTPHKRSLFGRKFELGVDDLVFIGHPVCVEDEGSSVSAGSSWRRGLDDEMARQYPASFISRGRTTTPKISSIVEDKLVDRKTDDAASSSSRSLASLNSFSLILVLDIPHFCSSPGDHSKYFDQIYQHVSVPVMAKLYQEHILHNLVEKESNILADLEEECIYNGDSYEAFATLALEQSALARAMENIYTSILKTRSLARVQLGADGPSVEIQLPPYLDALLRPKGEHLREEPSSDKLGEDSVPWGPQLEFGWSLPALTPRKAVLLLDSEIDEAGDQKSLADAGFNLGDLALFLRASSVIISLREMGKNLGWSLDARIYPMVRWLVFHHRVKVIDPVDAGLETVFCVSNNRALPLLQLSNEFADIFGGQIDLSLPEILVGLTTRHENGITIVTSRQTLYSLFVKTEERVPLWTEIVTWMMKRDLVHQLHLRVRIVISAAIKQRVYEDAKLGQRPEDSNAQPADDSPPRTSEVSIDLEDVTRVDAEESPDKDELQMASILYDPSRASSVEKRWLEAFSSGKEKSIVELFERVCPLFDGRKTAEEIMFRTGVSREELGLVLRDYEHDLLTFHHP